MIRRWPVGWFERLMLNYPLNAEEYSDYAEAFRSLGLEPESAASLENHRILRDREESATLSR
jgi:hypothetical protein